jgi:hypothetical protein
MGKVKFDGQLGTTTKQQPICAKYPPFLDVKLREIPDRSSYIRKAVVAQLIADGLLSEEEIELAKKLGLL